MKARWIGEGEWNETGWKERSRNEERKGATKTRPKKRNENNISKGVDEHKKQSRNGRLKRKTRENDKLRVVLKKGSWGGGGNEQNISRIAGNPLSASAIRAPLLKTPELQGKRRFSFLS